MDADTTLPSAILLDLDGTLIDAEPVHAEGIAGYGADGFEGLEKFDVAHVGQKEGIPGGCSPRKDDGVITRHLTLVEPGGLKDGWKPHLAADDLDRRIRGASTAAEQEDEKQSPDPW